MVTTNAFYRSDKAIQYATQLFSSSSVAATPRPTGRATHDAATENRRPTNDGATERAMARIIEIVTLGGAASAEVAKVSETFGYITGATATSGDDTLTLKGRAVYNVATDAGKDTVTIKTDSATAVDTGAGNDTLNISARYVNDIEAGAGDDTVQIAGRLALGVNGGEGRDTIRIAADTILGADGGAGDDLLLLEGARLSARGGTGNDTVTFRQTSDRAAEYLFSRGDGADTFSSNGPLSIRFDGTNGYRPDDVTVTATGNTLAIAFKGSQDKIAVTFEAGALSGTTPSYAFSLEQGAYVLKIR